MSPALFLPHPPLGRPLTSLLPLADILFMITCLPSLPSSLSFYNMISPLLPHPAFAESSKGMKLEQGSR